MAVKVSVGLGVAVHMAAVAVCSVAVWVACSSADGSQAESSMITGITKETNKIRLILQFVLFVIKKYRDGITGKA